MYLRFTSILAVICVFICLFWGCSSSPRYKRGRRSVRPSSYNEKNHDLSSQKKSTGNKLVGVASFYGPGFHGKKTASGERFNMYDLTAAHKTIPFNTKVKVTNIENNKSVVVRINDRGPYKKGRIIDLSKSAAEKIGLIQSGTAKVKLTIIK